MLRWNCLATGMRSGLVGRRLRNALIWGTAVLMGLYVCGWFLPYWEDHLSFQELRAFQQLAELADDMREQRAVGVSVSEDGTPYITSFDSFFAFVRDRDPHLVSKVDAPNPFPRILPGREYGRCTTPATSPSTPLIWSTRTYYIPERRKERWRLYCNGDYSSGGERHFHEWRRTTNATPATQPTP